MICITIKRFRHFIEGRVFHVPADQKPLTFALKFLNDSHTPRKIRHMAFIPEFTTNIGHVKASDNSVADALSRAVIALQFLLPPAVD